MSRLFALFLALFALPTMALAAPTKSGHLDVNGVNYYYELHGTGEPLLLLHGGMGSIDMFGPLLPALAKSRQVIAVDMHGHGRTALGDRAWSLEAMGDDMAAIVKKLGHEQVDVMGYSMGGGVAFRMAVQQPESVRRLVIVSAGYSDEGYYPELREMQNAVGAAMAEQMKETPMYKSYMKVAPKKEDFPRLLDTVGNFMRGHYDWSADVARLKGPVMLVYADSVLPDARRRLEGRRLAAGAHVEEPARDRAGPDALRLVPVGEAGADGDAVPGWEERGGELEVLSLSLAPPPKGGVRTATNRNRKKRRIGTRAVRPTREATCFDPQENNDALHDDGEGQQRLRSGHAAQPGAHGGDRQARGGSHEGRQADLDGRVGAQQRFHADHPAQGQAPTHHPA